MTNYQDATELAEMLKGVHTVLSFITSDADKDNVSQRNLINACVQSGVKRFAPSEWASYVFPGHFIMHIVSIQYPSTLTHKDRHSSIFLIILARPTSANTLPTLTSTRRYASSNLLLNPTDAFALCPGSRIYTISARTFHKLFHSPFLVRKALSHL